MNAKTVSDAVPIIRQAYEYALAQDKAFSTTPLGLDAPGFVNVADMVRQNNTFLQVNVPLPPVIDLTACTSGFAMVISAGTASMPHLDQLVGAPDSATRDWANRSLNSLIEVSTRRSHIAFILQWLEKVWPGVAEEFQDAVTSHERALSGVLDYPSVAFAMRNVLESLNGNVLETARKRAPSVPIRKWADAASHIARGAPASPEVARLAAESDTYSLLWERLTKVGKRDMPMTEPGLQALYAMFIGFLFAACSLIDIS